MIKRLLVTLIVCLLSAPAFGAGTIFGLPLSQQFDANGQPLSGAKLYLYEAGTSTPATAYEDFGLTTGLELSHPIEADSAGRIPEFWLADGSYRVRLTDAQGNEIFDINSTTALGASSGDGGGGGGDGVSESAIFDVGDIMWQPVNATRTGWVRANGRTIGSSSSGATERASSDTEDLFLFLWNTFSNALCPVSGGRGANAAADWAANKTIGTLDMRGQIAYGLDTMGNSAAGVVTFATVAAGAFGQQSKAIAQSNLPNVNFSHSLTAATHTHTGPSHTHTGPSHTHTFADTVTSGAGSSHTHSDGTYALGSNAISGEQQHVTAVTESNGNNLNGTGGNDYVEDIDVTSNTETLTVTSTDVSGTSGAEASHTHSVTVGGNTGASGTGATGAAGTGATGASGALAISGTVSSGGSATAFETLPPGRGGTWYLKL